MDATGRTAEHESDGPLVATTTTSGPDVAAVPGQIDLIALHRAIGNRAVGRLLRRTGDDRRGAGIGRVGAILLQRQLVDDLWPTDPQTVNSPFPLRVLISWLRRNPVAPHDLKYESAYDRSKVEPDPLGCEWKGGSSNVSSVTDAFMAESNAHGFSFRRDDVLMTIRDQVAKAKRERSAEISFMPKSDWSATGPAWQGWFPWPAYDDDADQFSLTPPDPVKGPGGPIVDWLEWYEFDAPWPPVADADACMIHAQGERTGRVLGVVRLYCNDAIRAGYLGVDRSAVEKHVRDDLDDRKQRKTPADHSRFSRIDGRGLKTARPPGAATAPPASVASPTSDDDFQASVGTQWTWTAGQAKADRSVVVTFQKGAATLQGQVSLDTGTVTWLAGAQPQTDIIKEDKDRRFLGALVSMQAFLGLLAGVTKNGPANGTFTVQAAVGAQLTLKWGPITVVIQGVLQQVWDPVHGFQAQGAVGPAAGPTSATLPPGTTGGLPPPPGQVIITIPF